MLKEPRETLENDESDGRSTTIETLGEVQTAARDGALQPAVTVNQRASGRQKPQQVQLTSPPRWSLSVAVSFSFRLDTSVISSSFWVSRVLWLSSS